MSKSDTSDIPAQSNIQGVKINLVKQHNNGQMPAATEVGCKLYRRMSRFADQPWLGPHWQAQDQSIQTIQLTCRPMIKNEQLNDPGCILVKFIK